MNKLLLYMFPLYTSKRNLNREGSSWNRFQPEIVKTVHLHATEERTPKVVDRITTYFCLRRAAATALCNWLSTYIHCRRLGIVHGWLACHPEIKQKLGANGADDTTQHSSNAKQVKSEQISRNCLWRVH